MKKLRRWPRVVLVILYIFLVAFLGHRIFRDYVLSGGSLTSSAADVQGKSVVLGVSIVQDDPATLLTELKQTEKGNDWSTSFFLQSQSPSVQIFLDYIAIYDDPELPEEICFSQVHLAKNTRVPLGVIKQVNLYNELGELNFSHPEFPEYYVYEFKGNSCLTKGSKYFMPHIFLGVISSESYANLLVTQINGQRAFEFFPLEEQKITLDLQAFSTASDIPIQPILEATISQQGWIGSFSENTGHSTVLHLMRPTFYRAILLIFFVIMLALIVLLNDVVSVAEGFFEISFGLLLGLWGTHEILIPNYIESSVTIDVMIYTLYILVIGEIIMVFIDEFLIDWKKHRVNIVEIVKGDLNQESVIIQNFSRIPIELTGWVLYDEANHRFKFPQFILKGKKRLKVWTADRGVSADAHHHFHWGRKKSIWNDQHDTAFLENAKGEVIHHKSYSVNQAKPTP